MPYSDKELLFNSLAQTHWDAFSRETLALIQRQYKPAPQVFISYAWPNRKYSSFYVEQDIQVWLLGLHERLTNLGVKVLFDIKSMTLATNIDDFTQLGLKNSDKILIIGTESYLKRSFEPTNVKTELEHIRQKVADNGASCVIPMLYRGESSNASLVLRSNSNNIQILSIDCHDEFLYHKNLPNLIENLFQLQSNFEYQALKQAYAAALKEIEEHELSDEQVNQFSQHLAAKARIALQAQREEVNKIIKETFKTHPDFQAQPLGAQTFSAKTLDYLRNMYQQFATLPILFGNRITLEKYLGMQILFATVVALSGKRMPLEKYLGMQILFAMVVVLFGKRMPLEKHLDMQLLSEKTLEHLKNKYQQHATVAALFGKPMALEDQYINVQMLYESYEETQRDEKQNQDNGTTGESSKNPHMLSQSTLTQKHPLEITQFFLPLKQLLKNNSTNKEGDLNNPPCFILLQGVAGAGKTTFVNYVSREWSMGRLWRKYDWVFTLRLRELRLKSFAEASSREETWSLSDWVYEIHFASLMEKPEFERFWHSVITPKLNDKVLFILDGYDETPKVHPCKKALADLLQSQTPKILTSRPYGLSDLPEKYRKLEVFGFVDKNIEKYIKLYFADAHVTKAEQIITALQSNPTLWDSAHIPVNLNILCGILEKSNELSTTLRELHNMSGQYEAMEMALLERAYCNVPGQEQRNTAQLAELARQDVALKNQLLQKHYESLREYLAQIAFTAFVNQQPYVSVELIHQELRNAGVVVTQISEVETVRALTSLGLLNPVLGKGKDAQEIIGYEFLHKTFEEYYAGRHILWQVKQTNLEKLIHDLSKVKLDPRYRPVLEFTASALKDEKQFDCFMGALTHPLGSDMLGHYQLGLLIRCTEENWDLAKRTGWVKLGTKQLQKHVQRLYKRYLINSNIQIPIWVELLKQSVQGYKTQNGWDDLFYRIKLSIMSDPAAKHRFCCLVARAQVSTVDTLVQLTYLLADKDWNVRRSAVVAIGELGASAAIPSVLKALTHLLADRDWYVRSSAVAAIGKLGASAAIPFVLEALTRLLADRDWDVQRSAVAAIGKLGASAAIPSFLEALTCLLADEDKYVRRSAVDAIEKLGARAAIPSVLEALPRLLADEDGDVRSSAVAAIGKLGARAAIPSVLEALTRLLADSDWYVRRSAVAAIGKLGASAAIPSVLEALPRLLADRDGNVRRSAVTVIVNLGASAAIPSFLEALPRLLADRDGDVRRSAVTVIVNLGVSAAIPSFLEALPRLLADNRDVRRSAVAAIGELGARAAIPSVLEALTRLLADRDGNVRSSAVAAIGELGARAAIPSVLEALTRLLADRDGNVRSRAIDAIGELGASAAITSFLEALPRLLADRDWDVRRSAVAAIGKLGASAAIPSVLEALTRLLADEDKYVRRSSVDAIGELGASAAIPSVLEALPRLLADGDGDVRSSALAAIGKLGASAAIPFVLEALTRLLADEDEYVRRSAVDAIGKLGASAAIPSVLEALTRLLADRDLDVRRSAVDAIGELAKSYLAQQTDVTTSENNFPILGAIITGSYLSGKTSYSIVWQAAQNCYLWQGFVDKEPFSIKLTEDQARWIRHQIPKIIKSLDTGAEKLSEIINTGINALPQAINDPMLFEYNRQKNSQALASAQLGLISNNNNNDLNLKVSVLNRIRFSDGDICLHDLTIDSIEYLEELMSALRNKQNIKSIAINNVKASNDALGEILEFIVKLREIEKIQVTNQNFSIKNWERICNIVENNPSLTYLGLAKNNINVGQFSNLAGYISRHRSLSELDLSHNRVSCFSVTLDDIKNQLEKCMTLKKVTINQNFLGKDSKLKFVSSSAQGLLCYSFFQTKADATPSILSQKSMIDIDNWVVALGCKRGIEHSMIYLEGMRKNGQRFLECYHIVATFWDKAEVKVQKFYEFHDLNADNLHLRPWEIRRETGHTLKLLVQEEQRADIDFSILSSTSFFEKRYNCLKWCLKLLTKIGIEHGVTDILPSSAATPSKNNNTLKF